ncbi:uncharacterized protein LOC111698985 [Eurytemora carolleeae]|uniref:uncharacterized protein LOC111698985 n=1 Tax=Eurytemora carolleeae TaxID=1294199 RepID=UPI000C784222|nr:uncharacterized protein LOC111698985 [Eurytemora carolleeae]XP_023325263.1 uncharacterized protein LOC111698985 [Eurytemora carolleeae]|eukprot:XP_023325262.1 uncharacterized protein LOC111698985 [Eurytemora affinis]
MEDYLFLSLLLSGFISFTLVSADQYPEIDQREDRGRTGDQLDYIYQDPDTEEMVQISLDEIVEFGEPSQIQTSLGDLTNLTFLPLPGEIREKENNKTISMTQEQITNSVLEKIQALLDAAGRNQTLEDILDILPKQVLDIPVHRQPQNHVKHPQDIFGELIASMEKYQGSENSSNLSVQYPEEQNSSFINLKFVLGTPDLENSEPNLENLEPYLETEPIIQDEDLPNLIEGDSEELIGNLDYTDTTDELKELFKNLRTRPGPSQLTEASLTRLTKPYTTRTPYRPGGSLRFDSTPSPTGEHGSTLASPGSTLTTQPSSDITFTDGLSFNPQYSPLKPAFPELLRYLLTENDLSSLMDRDIVQNQIGNKIHKLFQQKLNLSRLQ